MNTQNRNLLKSARTDLENAQEAIESAISRIREVREEEQLRREHLPEILQVSERAGTLESIIDELESAEGELAGFDADIVIEMLENAANL